MTKPETDKPAPTCEGCRWWERAKPYTWGKCLAPMPEWALYDSSDPIVWPGDEQAEDCDCYQPREETKP